MKKVKKSATGADENERRKLRKVHAASLSSLKYERTR
jgi:hypothetical protein